MSDYPRLDPNGLLYYTQQIKQKIDSAIPGDMVGASASANGAHGLVPQPNAGQESQFLRADGVWATPPGVTDDATQTTHGLMSAADKTKLDGIATGAQVNVIEEVQVNGVALTPSSKSVNVLVPTATSALTNDSDFQTGTEVDTKIASAVAGGYKPKGNCAFANLPTLTAEHVGWVYNVTDAFTTTSDFVEGAGKTYPANTDVVVIDVGSGTTHTYKYNIAVGFIDTSGFVLRTEMTTISNAEIDTIIDTAFNGTSA